MKVTASLAAFIIGAMSVAAEAAAPRADAVPAPQVEYLYDVAVRRHYGFANGDALSYGYGICDKVSQGISYAEVVDDMRRDVAPNDEIAVDYLISFAVDKLCPAQIWQLRNSAANYQLPSGQPQVH